MSALTPVLREELARNGGLPFSRFLELALYHPERGYYERADNPIGKHGDFYTSASVGPVFGELLAQRFQAWVGDLARPVVLEVGAHDGRLAGDILTQLNRDGRSRFEYWIVEPSARRRAWQQATLGAFGTQVRWFQAGTELPADGVAGVIFANELLDALPRHRVGWDAGARTWFEWGVRWRDERFVWDRLPERPRREETPETAAGPLEFPSLPAELLAVLPDGFTTETCPAARRWWTEMAAILREGYLLTIDYGLEAEEFFQPHRAGGTLRSYRAHRAIADVLADPGEQDITAMVDFSALRGAGERSGLSTVEDTSQARFLSRIFQTAAVRDASAWPASKVRQLQTLIHPSHLGAAFRVLAQRREVPPATGG